eukprot:scaffold13712_cov124-Isochrysis_galbana.AAC.3
MPAVMESPRAMYRTVGGGGGACTVGRGAPGAELSRCSRLKATAAPHGRCSVYDRTGAGSSPDLDLTQEAAGAAAAAAGRPAPRDDDVVVGPVAADEREAVERGVRRVGARRHAVDLQPRLALVGARPGRVAATARHSSAAHGAGGGANVVQYGEDLGGVGAK